ncbi:MAG: hypothetical protein PHC94_15605 [Methylobacter sp.]|nr:hypothetical protein [Methylobacter sp.]
MELTGNWLSIYRRGIPKLVGIENIKLSNGLKTPYNARFHEAVGFILALPS